MTRDEKIREVAIATHQMNLHYCTLIEDPSQVPWHEAPNWQKASAITGVVAVLEGSASTPEEQHEHWYKTKEADGWVYGEVKDPETKTHPCMVPYSDLPPEQQAKDAIFRATVRGVAAHLGLDLAD
jgi:hypothetical protein